MEYLECTMSSRFTADLAAYPSGRIWGSWLSR